MLNRSFNATKILNEICRIKEEFKMFNTAWITCLQTLKWLKLWALSLM